MRGFAEILGLGMTTPVGLTATATAAAVRAGISRIQELPIRDTHFQPYKGAVIPEAVLPALPEGQGDLALSARQLRTLRLSTPALQQAARSCEHPVTLLLGVSDDVREPTGRLLLEMLARVSDVPVDARYSRCFAKGRAAGLVALQQALQVLSSGQASEVLVGGTDSLVDPRVLLGLEEQGRLPPRFGPSDALYPGEAAAFLLLGKAGTGKRLRLPVLARVVGVGVGQEPGHLYSREPHRGDGLAFAVQSLFADCAPERSLVRSVYAGFTGERFFAMEWGIAFLRSRKYFAEELSITHPAENVGDVGAAQGTMMVGLAAQGLYKGYRRGPILIWAASDKEERAAALIDGPQGSG